MSDGEKTVAGGGSVGFGVLLVWLAGHYGIDMSAEVGTILGGFAGALGGAVASVGLVGIGRTLLFGQAGRDRHALDSHAQADIAPRS
jgi:hypothetical protein